MQISHARAAELLKAHDNILIICHANPDGDTLGSGFGLFYALKNIGKKVSLVCSDEFLPKFSYFYPEDSGCADGAEFVVSVDVASPSLYGEKYFPFAARTNLSIDHHISNTGYAENTLLDSDAAATCEIMPELIDALGTEIDRNIARALYTGLATDTGCFKFTNTTAKTHRTAARLIESGADNGFINELVFETISKERLEIERMATNSLKFFADGKCAVVVLTLEAIERSGATPQDIEGVAAIPRRIAGVRASAVLKQTDSEDWKVSLRARPGTDVSAVAAKLGGGGHRAAAGCRVKGTEQEALEKILEQLLPELENPTAGETGK